MLSVSNCYSGLRCVCVCRRFLFLTLQQATVASCSRRPGTYSSYAGTSPPEETCHVRSGCFAG